LKYFFKECKSLPAEISHPANISLPADILREIIFICPSTETWKEKNQLRLEATKKLRLVCKDWYECLRWNILFLNNILSLKVCCLHKISGELPERLKSEIYDEQPLQDEFMLHVTMFFTSVRLKEYIPTLYPNCLIIEYGFQLPSQFNLQRVCKLIVMAKDETSSYQYIMTEPLVKLLESISSESLKILVLDHMYITDKVWQLLSSRFLKLEYLELPNCKINNPNIYWWKFSSIKTLTLTLLGLRLHENIVLHLKNETGGQLKFNRVGCNFL
jgi:hypothetical protein